MMRFHRTAGALLLAVSASCTGSTEPGAPQELRSLPRTLSQAELDVRDASNRFTFSLFRRLSEQEPGRNVFVSPLSVSMSLGMALNGAAGQTRSEMAQTLGFGTAELPAIQAGYRDLRTLLVGLDPATAFQIANSIWYRQGFAFEPTFLEAGRTYFDAEIRGLDFSDAEGTKRTVNAWVTEKTNGRIPTILQEVHPDDVMYLTNAIWFKGQWRTQFNPRETYDGQFTKRDGTRQSVRMMRQTADSTTGLRGWVSPGLTVAELPYGNGAYAMTLVMPAPGSDIDTFAGSLTEERWNELVTGLRDTPGWEIHLPRFTLTYSRDMEKDLPALGMPTAFTRTADFTGMSRAGGLYIAFVKHKTFVQVDEVGTEAAAVTNTGVRVVSLPPGYRFDRPFVYAIRERLSGTILFVGKMVEIP